MVIGAQQIPASVPPVAAAVIVVAQQSCVTVAAELQAQIALLAIGGEIFAVTEIGVQDDFSSLNSYSLLGGRRVERVHNEFALYLSRLSRAGDALDGQMHSYRLVPRAERGAYFAANMLCASRFDPRKACSLIAHGALDVHQVQRANSSMLDEPQVQALGCPTGTCLKQARQYSKPKPCAC